VPVPDWVTRHLAAQRTNTAKKVSTAVDGISAQEAKPVTPIDAAAKSLARAFGGVVVQLDDPLEEVEPPAPRHGKRTATKLRMVDGDPVDLWLPATQRWVAGLYLERTSANHAHLRGGRGPLAVPIQHVRRSVAAPD